MIKSKKAKNIIFKMPCLMACFEDKTQAKSLNFKFLFEILCNFSSTLSEKFN